MCVGEKLKSIILRGHVDYNIYNSQTWITNTTTKGQILFTNSAGVSRMMPLVRENNARGKCVIVEDLSSFRLINIPFSNRRTISLHQWSACVCVCGWCLGSSVWLDITERFTPIIRMRQARSGRACVSSVSISLIATPLGKHKRPNERAALPHWDQQCHTKLRAWDKTRAAVIHPDLSS